MCPQVPGTISPPFSLTFCSRAPNRVSRFKSRWICLGEAEVSTCWKEKPLVLKELSRDTACMKESVMWKCNHCGQTVADSYEICWKCSSGNKIDGIPVEDELSADVGQNAASTYTLQPVMSRYTDAYLVARTTTTIGSAVKIVGIVLAVLTLVIGFIVANRLDQSQFGLLALLWAVIVGVPLYVLGILVSAQGQILKATLDSAVTNSPFLTEDQMAEVMSLPEIPDAAEQRPLVPEEDRDS